MTQYRIETVSKSDGIRRYINFNGSSREEAKTFAKEWESYWIGHIYTKSEFMKKWWHERWQNAIDYNLWSGGIPKDIVKYQNRKWESLPSDFKQRLTNAVWNKNISVKLLMGDW